MKKLNFLPTKVLYDKRNSNIKMWFRLPNKHDLMCTDVPFAHSIFIEKGYSKYGEFSENDIYYYLTNDEIEMFELFISPSEAQDIYKSERYVTGEADCSPEQKFITQTFYDTEFPAEIKPRIFFLDIETYSTDGKLPLFNHNIAVINAITLYDTYTKKYYSWFLKPSTIKLSNKECYDKIKNEITDYGEAEIIIFNDAKLLLGSFINFINKECPDIITAWNLPFDMPYIVRKIIDNFGINELKKISPFNRISSKVTKALDTNLELKIDSLIPGIDSIDYLELYKKNTPGQKPSYRLADIALEELHAETKLVGEDGESDPNIMYINNFIHFCKYNIQDVRIMKLIEEKRKILDLAIIIRNITKTNYQDIFYETALIDNMFLMEAIRRRKNGWKYVLPSKPINAIKVPYLGAYVKAPIKGRFEWVADLDFKSLYPSIVKTFKLSNESVVGIVKNKQVITLYNLAKQFKISDFNYIKEELLPKYLSYDPDLLQVINDNVDIKALNDNTPVEIDYYYALYTNKDFPMIFDTIKQFAFWIKENNFVFMPNGVIIDQNREDAIIAKVIADIMKSREDYKKLMLESLAKNDKAKAEMYDTYQTAVKVVNNSVYGVTAKESFRLADVKIADAITTTGQLLIRSSTYIANEKLNELSNTKDQDYVITNDTDSIIFTLRKVVDYPVTTRDPNILAEIAKYSTICQEYVNDSVYDLCKNLFYKHKISKSNNFLMIKNEWLADAGLFIAKKMYAVHKVFKEGIPYDKLVPTGLSLKRSSTPAALKPFIEKVIVNILSFKNKLEIDEIIIEECRKLKEEYNIKDVAIPSSLNDLDKYLNVPIHVRGIKIWNKYFAPSDRDKLTFGKLKYFYVKGWENNKLNLDKEYVLSVPNNDEYWILIKDKVIVDYNRMKERLIFKPINAFYNAMEWEMPASISSTSNNIFLNVKSKSKFKIL